MKKIIEFNKPCVVYSTDGYNVKIILFEEENDAKTFWLDDTEDMYEYEPELGLRQMHLDGKVDIEYLGTVSVLYWTHEDLEKYMDDMYNLWVLKRKGLKYDVSTNQYVPCYEAPSDYGYPDIEDYDPPFDNLPF
jgi:hypothetical protein